MLAMVMPHLKVWGGGGAAGGVSYYLQSAHLFARLRGRGFHPLESLGSPEVVLAGCTLLSGCAACCHMQCQVSRTCVGPRSLVPLGRQVLPTTPTAPLRQWH